MGKQLLAAMSQWIPIFDRWPEAGTPVLVSTVHGMTVCAWELVQGSIRWWTPHAVCGEYGYEAMLSAHRPNKEDAAVTHWMPLPAPPQSL